ncbi:MAG: ABC transporter permease, partial [Proteobacteria bacterium]|nr:ABC transporter permease [Pseudomonadota bacterium]
TMVVPYEIWIGLRHLRARRGEGFASLTGWLSVGGVAVGVAAVVVVLAVMSGFQEALRDKILSLSPHVLVYPLAGPLRDPEAVARCAEEVAGVRSAAAVALGHVVLSSGAEARGVVLRGLDPDGMARGRVADLVTEGSIAGIFGDVPALLVGRELARSLGLTAGSAVQVLTSAGTGPRPQLGYGPRVQTLRVAGVFTTGMYDLDLNLVLASLGTAQDLFALGEGATGIEVFVQDALRSDEVARAVEAGLGPGYLARSWSQANRNLFVSLRLQKVVLALILGVIVVVAAFNLASGLIMKVLERTPEIGVLMAMGATPQSIRKVFGCQGLLIGSAGAGVGLLLGGGICLLLDAYPLVPLAGDVYYPDRLPISAQPALSLAVAGGAVVLCWAASLYPSWQASRLDPVEILRGK